MLNNLGQSDFWNSKFLLCLGINIESSQCTIFLFLLNMTHAIWVTLYESYNKSGIFICWKIDFTYLSSLKLNNIDIIARLRIIPLHPRNISYPRLRTIVYAIEWYTWIMCYESSKQHKHIFIGPFFDIFDDVILTSCDMIWTKTLRGVEFLGLN